MAFRAWYERTVLPHIIRCGCSSRYVMALRAEVVPLAKGRVFEMGVGGGLNQQFYDADKVSSFAGIDPSDQLLDFAQAAARTRGWSTDIRQGVGEDIPFPDASFDTVVCTFTLCSVNDHARVLKEMYRILVPGGSLLFLEHGRAPDLGVQAWQRRIEPAWKTVFGNCHISREISPAMQRHGFRIEQSDHKYLEKTPRFAGFMEWGVARKD